MLRLGLTGGIGAGKSTVARRLVDLGAVVADADRIAREVVEPGSEGLAEVRQAFGDRVIGTDGALDRQALGQIVFGDPQARGRLEAITHPKIAARTAELFAAAARDGAPTSIAVHDVPLLVEKRMSAEYHLVVVVDAPVEVRLARLVARGLPEDQARARIAAQASVTDRRAAADIWLDNSGSPRELEAAVKALWGDRLLPFAENLAARRPAPGTAGCGSGATPSETTRHRLQARLRVALGDPLRGVDAEVRWTPSGIEVGTTSPGDVEDAVCAAGYAPIGPHLYGSCDPGRAGTLVRVVPRVALSVPAPTV